VQETTKRNSCVICASETLKEIYAVDRFPVYMGITATPDLARYDKLEYRKCETCSALQLGQLIPLAILYHSNHNAEVVGEIWKGHFRRFSEFILQKADSKSVLEIGDPSAKLAKRCLKNNGEWTIVEPNFNSSILDTLLPRIKYEQVWFADFNVQDKKYDTVVLSHVFEHLYDPVKTLNKISRCITADGKLLLSIPNMEYLLQRGHMPPGGMHFEHTYYLSLDNLKFLLNRCGFEIEAYEKYLNHSLFISCAKKSEIISEDPSALANSNDRACYKMKKVMKSFEAAVVQINKTIESTSLPVYMYGAHFPAQLLLSMGIKEESIVGILDNSADKIGKYLYGTSLKVQSPRILRGKKAVVICHMGAYTDEIKADIIDNISDHIIFI